jgi:UDP-glucose 6-dehydrogenase
MGEKLGVYSGLLIENDRYNDLNTKIQIEKIKNKIGKVSHVAIFGLAYKPLSFITEKAPGLEFAKCIASLGISLAVHDPLSEYMDECNEGGVLKKFVVSNAYDALKPGCLVLLNHPTTQYIDILREFSSINEFRIFDFWRACNEEFGMAIIERVGVDDGSGRGNLVGIYSKEQ